MKKLMHYAFATVIGASPIAAQAMPMAIDFAVHSSLGGAVSGSGTALTDSANLVPGAYTTNLDALTALSMSLSGASGAGTVSFTKNDLYDFG